MKKSRKKQKKGSLTDKELRRYVIFLMIPCLLLLLLIVVLIFGDGRDSGEGTKNSSASQIASSVTVEIPEIEPDTKEYIQDFGGSILEQDKVPEINYLMARYFYSMSICDMDTFMQLFTSQDTSQTDVFRVRFEKQREYIEGYQNISCYTAKGLEDNSYVVYVYYEKKFVNVDTLCPSMFSFYAVKGDDGQYRIYDETVLPELEEYLERIAQNEDVRLLSTMVDRKLEEAQEEDPELEKRIAYLKKGPDYMQDDEDGTSQEGEEAE